MSFRLSKGMLPVAATVLFCACGTLQKTTTKRKGSGATTTAVMAKADTAKKGGSGLSKVKPYKEVITAKAVTDSGLFIIHRVEDKYYFEIPNSLLDRDILTVNRITKGAADVRPLRGFFGYAGDEIGENVIQFSRGSNDKVFIKRMSYSERSKDSSENGMYRSVRNSNFQPIIASFDIKAYRLDSTGVVLDMTDYMNGDNDVFFFDTLLKRIFGLSGLQADKSYIVGVSSFPENIEIKTVKTYGRSDEGAFINPTYELNSSIVLLPEAPMQPRYYDARVGYFSEMYRDFDANPQGVEYTAMITRWRLEPKAEDIEKYKRGALVEPKKPIVFYIDPATPKKWVPYLIQGVNDWQQAFEKAGFKNAIYALEAPKDDSSWSLEDARHNVIVYKPSFIPNAYGPHVRDPRTGEILESKVGWFHNVMALLHDWYMVQAAAIDPKARKMEFDDELMGQLIRFVSSHEIGHTLGLAHNFGSSSTVPVDSLRNKRWVEANGHTPSIMDYARFNYVAQPEDNISEKGIFPRIGVYDEWAIEWGYKWLPELKTEEGEKAYMDKWIISKLNKDKRLWFGSELGVIDPRRQSEDLGDNAMKAGYYGIKNLKRIMPQLIKWTREPHEGYSSLGKMQGQVIGQYLRYLFHVARNIGGIKTTMKTASQEGPSFEFISQEQQKAAVRFLQDELFTTPYWIMNKEIFALGGGSGAYYPYLLQKFILGTVMSHAVFTRLLFFESNQPGKAYTFNKLLQDLQTGIWSELKTKKPIDLYRRNLQKTYAAQLVGLLRPQDKVTDDDIVYGITNINTDDISVVKGQIRKLLTTINNALPAYKDEMSRMHLMDVKERLMQGLEIERTTVETGSKANALNSLVSKMESGLYPSVRKDDIMDSRKRPLGCWEVEEFEGGLYLKDWKLGE